QKPTWFGWMLRGPSNLKSVWDRTFRKDNLDALASIAASSALLIAYDEEILLGSQKLARKVGLISDSKSGREINYLFKEQVNGVDLPIYVPANTNSTLYYIGDGYTQLGIVSSMVGYGLWNNDYRALSAASQNVEALFITGIMIQLFKRTTGREAPFRRTEEGGKWQWFPNQEDYNKDVPKYDAFPSGHLATAMAATTVFADNYPDHAYIKPVGYTLMGLLAFGMLNNGVHWAGDYPLGIAIGYTSAKVVTSRIKKRGVIVSERTDKAKWQFVPTMIGTAPAIGYRYTH
ncbi:MAG: phosphatase PAP2 family protein, partial [Gammaproteobacteria bacterium]|nr:phosphatase PAP2 family protein [Gammaproteobacteria bacterium]